MSSPFARGFVVLAMVVGLFGPGCGQRKRGSPSDGRVANGEYTNSFFGFALPVPNGWSIVPHKALDATLRVGQTLVMISEHPPEAAVAFNASIIGVAEMVRDSTGVKTGGDYLSRMRTGFKLANSKLQSRGPPKQTQLGGRSFYREQYFAGMVEQAYYAAVSEGYVLGFVVSASSKDDLLRVEAKLKDLRFQ